MTRSLRHRPAGFRPGRLPVPAIAVLWALAGDPSIARQAEHGAAAVTPPPAASPHAVVFLVRHAEKAAAPAEDPPLADAGRRRAARLAEMLGDARIGRIIASQYRRTRETAEQVSLTTGAPVAVVPVRMDSSRPGELTPDHLDSLLAAIRTAPGGRALVVGHSNTVPAVMRALGAEEVPAIGEGEYDNLFILTWLPQGSTHLVRLRY